MFSIILSMALGHFLFYLYTDFKSRWNGNHGKSWWIWLLCHNRSTTQHCSVMSGPTLPLWPYLLKSVCFKVYISLLGRISPALIMTLASSGRCLHHLIGFIHTPVWDLKAPSAAVVVRGAFWLQSALVRVWPVINCPFAVPPHISLRRKTQIPPSNLKSRDRTGVFSSECIHSATIFGSSVTLCARF